MGLLCTFMKLDGELDRRDTHESNAELSLPAASLDDVSA
jgi:hypothetical protein